MSRGPSVSTPSGVAHRPDLGRTARRHRVDQDHRARIDAARCPDLADAWVAALADQVAAIENPKGRNDTLRLVPMNRQSCRPHRSRPTYGAILDLASSSDCSSAQRSLSFDPSWIAASTRPVRSSVIRRDCCRGHPRDNSLARDKHGVARTVVLGLDFSQRQSCT